MRSAKRVLRVGYSFVKREERRVRVSSFRRGYRASSLRMEQEKAVDPQSELGCSLFKEKVLQNAIKNGVLGDNKKMAFFWNFSYFEETANNVKSAFPDHWLHTMAMKANPLLRCVQEVYKHGIGFEAASQGELVQALKVAPPEHVVFDSPVKTIEELKYSLKHKIYLNLDNFQELERVDALLKTPEFAPYLSSSHIGLRINPQVGEGSIKEFSTAGQVSKFGIDIAQRSELLHHYKTKPYLSGIHVHVGSQGCSLSLNVRGIRSVLDLVKEINLDRSPDNHLSFIDIGGGFPVNFSSENISGSFQSEIIPPISSYSSMLKESCPELFDPSLKLKVFTEYGRYYNAKAGFFVSQVEYTKISGGRRIALIHAGLDLFVRTIYMPKTWVLRATVFDKNGKRKEGKRELHNIAGPCCIAGDVVAYDRELPEIEEGDWVMMHDTGGYYVNAYSYYNSRQRPDCWGVYEGKEGEFVEICKAHSVEDTLKFYQ
eukprot:TRINITY_DN8336_c0_g1_i1.p1 TRINITY_DN8336_c0_g1~~TRINITY_DN8336_c0_g1_i1.p1  ORF type:complete len:486 (-),score=96.10 TRINITY_DN8336_c0_g1_i1:25-1482(-)